MSINNLEGYNKRELIETIKIAQEEYQKLHKEHEALKQRAEKAERELLTAHGWIAKAMMRGGCNDIAINAELEKLANQFAIQQKIEGIEEAISDVEFRSEGKNCARYCFSRSLHNYADKLRKQLEEMKL